MNDPQIDLTGKLIIKVQLGDDIRRILITNEDITYDELMLMMQRVYRGKLSSTDDIVIKYKDEDNDLITIFDSSDLTFATQCSRILKITLFVNGKPEPLHSNEVKHIKKQLQQIRDQCNNLLDRLDERVVDTLNVPADSTGSVKLTPMVTDSPKRPSPVPRITPPSSTTAVNSSKEFDPLSTQKSVDDSQQNKVMSSFGIANDISSSQERPGTPDSVISVGSSSSHTRQLTPQDPQKTAPSSAPSQPQFTQPTQPAGGTGVYGGPSMTTGQKLPPWQQSPSHQSSSPAQPSQASQYPTQQPGYPGASSQSPFPGQAGQSQTSQPGQSQTSQPGHGGASSQYGYTGPQGGAGQPSAPGMQPGQGQMFGQPGYSGQPQQPGQQASQQSQYAGFGQQQQQQPGMSSGQQQPGMSSGQQQPGMSSGQQQPGMSSGQQQQQPGMPPAQQQPIGPAPGGQPGQQSGAPSSGGSSNPYARPSQGPGYPSGYPRPSGTYQGYQ